MSQGKITDDDPAAITEAPVGLDAGRPFRLPPGPLDDPARLAALDASGGLDPSRSPSLDALARLARRSLGAAKAAVNLVASGFQHSAGADGFAAGVPRSVPLPMSVCRNVVETGRVLRIDDVAADPGLAGHAGVGANGIAAYLGVPLRSPDGLVLGAFCVIDDAPYSWTDDDVALVEEFARAAMAEVTARRVARDLARDAADMRLRQARLDAALDASGRVGTWALDVASGRIRVDRHAARLMGLDPEPAAAGIGAAGFASRIHPEDRDGVVAAISAALVIGTAGERHTHDFRVIHPDGSTMHLESRGCFVTSPEGRPELTGAVTDVTRLRLAAQRQADISAEMGHRMKNMMATVQAIVFQTLRESDDMSVAAQAVTERMVALGRSHDLLHAKGWGAAGLHEAVDLVTGYFGRNRFDVSGPEIEVPPRAALALSMALHELSTNAVKYGAFSNATGRVSIRWDVTQAGGEERLTLAWAESGGPPVARPTRRGLGTRLLERVLSSELHGGTALAYEPDGLRCSIEGDLGRIRQEHAAARAAGH